jgi:hypothetical protein
MSAKYLVIAVVFVLLALIVRSIARMRRDADQNRPGPHNNWRKNHGGGSGSSGWTENYPGQGSDGGAH